VSRVRSAAIAIALGLGLAVVAARISPSPVPPLYDGVPIDVPYVGLDPPPGHSGNPSSNTATVKVAGGTSPLVTLDTLELAPQAQMFAPPGGLILPPGTTSLTISIQAVEPVALPTDGHIDGNVYRIYVVNQAGDAITADPTALVTVIMRASGPPPGPITMELFADGAWTPLKTDPEGPNDQYRAVVTRFGDFAMVLPGPSASGPGLTPVPTTSTEASAAPLPSAAGSGGGSSIPQITIYAGIAIGLVLLGLLATALLPGRGRSRGRNRNRGWDDRPPRRTRR